MAPWRPALIYMKIPGKYHTYCLYNLVVLRTLCPLHPNTRIIPIIHKTKTTTDKKATPKVNPMEAVTMLTAPTKELSTESLELTTAKAICRLTQITKTTIWLQPKGELLPSTNHGPIPIGRNTLDNLANTLAGHPFSIYLDKLKLIHEAFQNFIYSVCFGHRVNVKIPANKTNKKIFCSNVAIKGFCFFFRF